MTPVASVFFVPFPVVFKQRLLQWLRRYPCVAFYDSNNWTQDSYSTHDLIAGCANALVDLGDSPLLRVSQLVDEKRHYLFGYFGYDLKNKIETLCSDKPNRTGFPDACFFKADVVFELSGSELAITASTDTHAIFESVMQTPLTENETAVSNNINIQHRTSKKKYLQTVDALRQHIEDGDFYEINYCQEFYCEAADINPTALFAKLNRRSAAPFSAYMKFNELYVVSSSPERFLKRLGDKLVSQPIKGTARRDISDATSDERLKEALRSDEKEKAENVMIVDLVRNDLNRICKTASVAVKELFGVYSFPTVHHMVSTVVGTLRPDVTFEQIFKATFPMGSMTGAPKVEVMKAIEFYEDTARGAYSGTAGYVTPDGDFDFNVVIRTVLWNETTRYLSYHAGGAVTFDSDAEAEYAECLLKAKAISELLAGSALVEK